MKATFLQNIDGNQDGAAYAHRLFRFDAAGNISVWDLTSGKKTDDTVADRRDVVMPHANAVVFGTEKYEETDAFPLLYANVYNSHANEADRREGTLCVYRVTGNEGARKTALVQVIRIGFTENPAMWKSLPDNGDVRPFGNFVIDGEHNELVAFVMRDGPQTTRYFTFALPRVRDGVPDKTFGVPTVTLTEKDVLRAFDGPYAHYVQGATCRRGILYSLEGFHEDSKENYPRLQRIDVRASRAIDSIDLPPLGLGREPEMVTFDGDTLLFSDGDARLFSLDLTE